MRGIRAAIASLLAATLASAQGAVPGSEWTLESADARGAVLLWENRSLGRPGADAPRSAALGLPMGARPMATVEILAEAGGQPVAGIRALPAAAAPIEFSASARYRDLEVASLTFNPAARGRIAARARVRVDFRASAPSRPAFAPPESGATERHLAGWILNYAQSRGFRGQPTRPLGKSAAGPSAGASLPRIRLLVRTFGENIQVLDYQALRKAGVPLGSIDPRYMRLWRDGVEVPMYIGGGDDGKWDGQDYIEFIGSTPTGDRTRPSLFVSTATFMLTWEGGRLGLRAPAVPVAARGQDLQGAPSSVKEAPPFKAKVHLEEDLEVLRIGSTAQDDIVDLGARVQESELSDFWMWERQGPDKDTKEIPFTLDHEPVALGRGGALKAVPFRMKVNLKGITNNPKADPDHHVKFILNGKDISLVDGVANDAIWEGQESYTWSSKDLDPGVLKAGRNILVIQKVNDLKANDSSTVEVQDAYLNWFEMEFPSSYKAQSDRLSFSNDFEDSLGVRLFTLSGFTKPDLSVWDLGGRKLTGYRVIRRGSTYDVALTDSLAGPTRYVAVALSGREAPLAVLDTLPDLVSPAEGADWLVITHRDLLGSALDSLVEHRRKQGYRTKVVQVSHIYQAFGDGSLDPAAIRRFVEHAYRSWPRPAPAYLLLAGETSLWYEKRGGGQQRTLVPTQLVNIHGWGVAANDDWYVKVSGDDALADLFVGRIPAANVSDLSRVVRKILSLETKRPAGHWANKALLVSGFEDIFAQQNGRLQALSVARDRQYSRLDLFPRSPHYRPMSRHQTFLDQLDSGFTLVSFIGHGGGAVWSDAGVLTLRHLDEKKLQGEWPIPLVSSITCLTGYFEDVTARSLGEEMVRLEKGGAAAFYGAAGYISNLAGEALSYEVVDAVSSGAPTVGAAIHRAETMVQLKTAGAFGPILSEFNLLGDPAMRLAPPSPAGRLSLDPVTQTAGTSMTVRGTGLAPEKADGVLTLFLGDSALGATAVGISRGAFDQQRNLVGLSGPVPDGKALLHYWDGKESRVAKASFTTLDWLIDSVRLEPASPAPGESATLHIRLSTAYRDIAVDGGVALYAVGSETPPAFPEDNQRALRAGAGGLLSTEPFTIPVPGPELAKPGLFAAFRLSVRVLDANGETVRNIGNLSSRTYALPLSELARLSFAEPVYRVPVQESLGVWAAFRNGGLGKAAGFKVVLTKDAEGPLPGADTVVYAKDLALGGLDSVFFPLADSLASGKRLRVTLMPARDGELADRGTVKDTVMRLLTRRLASTRDTLRLDSAAWLTLSAEGSAGRVFAEPAPAASLPAHLAPALGRLPAEAWRVRTATLPPSRLVFGASLPAAPPPAKPAAGSAAADRPFWHFRDESAGAAQPWLKLDTASAGHPWTATGWKGGLYGSFFNRDISPPLVQFSSRGQALLQDDYVPQNTPINVVVRDAEGVDMSLRPPTLASRRQATDSATLAVEAGATSPTLMRFNFLAKHGAAQDSLEVVASDVSGNVTRKTLAYRHGRDLTIRNLGSFPNPFADTAIFVYSLTDYCEKVQLKVFSRAGRLVRSLEERNVVGYREVVWDGKAESGASIGNGLYFLKVTAKAGDQEASKVFKLFKKRRK